MVVIVLAESTVEWIAGVVVAAVLALVGGWRIGYAQIKSAVREERAKDVKAARDDRTAEDDAERERIRKDNDLWHSECVRLIGIYTADRQRWLEEMKEVRAMVDHVEEVHRQHLESCEAEVASLQGEVAELKRHLKEGGIR